MRSGLQIHIECGVVGCSEDVRQSCRSDALGGVGKILASRETTRETVRHFHGPDEQYFEPRKRAIGDAGAAEPRAIIALVAISTEPEVVIEYRGTCDVLPVERPIPVPMIELSSKCVLLVASRMHT